MSILLHIIAPDDLRSILIGVLTFFIVLQLRNLLKKFKPDPRFVKFAETLPGPAPLPLLGNSLDFCRGENTVKRLEEYRQKYGNIYRLWLGKYLVIGLSGVEDLEVVFMNSKMLGKPEIFRPFADYWGDSLFTAPMHLWKKTRKRFQPTFVNNRTVNFIPNFNGKIYNLVNELRKFVDEPEFDANDYLVYTAFDVVTKTTLNNEFKWDDPTSNTFRNDSRRVIEVSYKTMCLPWLHIKFIRDLLYKKEIDEIRTNAVNFSANIYRNTMNEINDEIQRSKAGEIQSKLFITTAYELSEELNSDILLHDEIIDIITAGTTTTSTVIGYTLLALAIYQDIQDKLYDEVYEIFGDTDRYADDGDLKRLPYLDKVIKETLRRFTLVPAIYRSVDEDSKIGDRIIPAGTTILVSIAAIHFNPDYYPDPWKFNPENFNAEATEKRPKLAFIPFSAGPRNCVGLNYAMQEIKLAVIALLRNFSFHTTIKMEDIKWNMDFVMFPKCGFKLSIKSRIRTPSYLRKN